MNTKLLNAAAALVACSALLAACGGSDDDEAGQLSPFQVQPAESEFESTTTSCPAIKAGDFLVVGGTAPYTVYSPYSQLVTFSAAGGASPTHTGQFVVPDRNNQFSLYMQGCFEPAVVTILDSLKRVVTLEVSYKASGAS